MPSKDVDPVGANLFSSDISEATVASYTASIVEPRDVIRDPDLATTLTTIPDLTDGEALRSEIHQIVEARLRDPKDTPSSRATCSSHMPFEKAFGGQEAR